MGSLHKNIQLMLDFLRVPFSVLHFSYYTLITSLMLAVMLACWWYSLYSKCDQASDLWQQVESTSKLEYDLRDSVDLGRKHLPDFNAGKNNYFCLTRLITLVLLLWKWMGLFLRKNHILRRWGWLSLLNWIWALAKTTSKKIGTLIPSMKFYSPEVALCLFKSNIWPCMEYCCQG